MKTFIKFLLVCIVLLVFIPLAAATYFGFVPILSPIFGFNNPKDLGVKYTEADRLTAYIGNGVESIKLPSSTTIKDSLRYEGKKEVKTSFTSAEITALINSVSWKYMPIYNVQIKINQDGTGQVSGILNTARIIPYISLTVSPDTIKAEIEKNHFATNPTFYLKGKANVIDNKVSLDPQEIKIGQLPIPQALVASNIPLITTFIEDRLKSVPNLLIKSFNLDGGKINCSATVPAKEYTAQ